MSDVDQHPEAIYALYPVFRARDGFRDLSAEALADVVQEVGETQVSTELPSLVATAENRQRLRSFPN